MNKINYEWTTVEPTEEGFYAALRCVDGGRIAACMAVVIEHKGAFCCSRYTSKACHVSHGNPRAVPMTESFLMWSKLPNIMDQS